ncbi:MAG TPA: SRPBCC family protein [Paraburkholderia sp.]|uniref:SRPBCC family protein n=1 Tax=Paraburkholderia sp. TaxID=1926495 RepID=UPI002C8F81C0|nr:SRPBCC family protein [Paraburkholderia sp.]HTR07555.1 SRPBCC family protein [Paraburkholderia sp.]
MKVVLDKVFPLAASADSAWQLMQDIEAVAGCMPGAKVTERIDDTHYKGTITVKLGPATMAFKGDIEVLALDAASRSLHLVGKGTDSTGSSAATMNLTAAVQGSGEGCELSGKSEVTMSGKAAAIGGRLMGPVSEQLLKQFVANFSARLDAMNAQAEGAGDAASATAGEAGAPEAAGGAPARPAQAVQAPPAELNGLSFVWAMIRDWVRGIFSHKAHGR